MPKSPDAFRTISEVADWLGIQAHVLRFWESKFTQVKPIKRAGGRRYYRPADMQLLGGIRKLLHEDGLTIKGVQKILREEGMSHVAAMSVPLEDADGEALTSVTVKPVTRKTPEPEEAVVLPFGAAKEPERVVEVIKGDDPLELDADADATEDSSSPEEEISIEADSVEDVAIESVGAELQPAKASNDHSSEPAAVPSGRASAETQSEPIEKTAETTNDEDPSAEKTSALDKGTASEITATDSDEQLEFDETSDQKLDGAPAADAKDVFPKAPSNTEKETQTEVQPPPEDVPAEEAISPLPSFLRDPMDERPTASAEQRDGVSPDSADAAISTDAERDAALSDTPKEPSAQVKMQHSKARDIGMPTITSENEIHAEVSALTGACKARKLNPATAQEVKLLLTQLSALRDRMAARAGGAQPKF